MTYEELLERGGLPEEFYSMHVTFLVDDEPVKQLICSYGQAVNASEIPEVPKKAGFYEKWEDVDLSDIRRNYKIHAVYQPWVNTIAVSDDPMPELLAEAQFMPEASLTLQEIDTADLKAAGIAFPSGAKRVKAYRYEAADPQNPNAPETVTLHVLSGGASGVGLVTENGLQEIAARKDGKYLMFEAPASGEYVLWHTYPVRLIGSVVIAMTLAVLILLVKKHGRRKPGGQTKKNRI
jgi:surface antigen